MRMFDEKYKLMDTRTGQTVMWPLSRIIEDINRDRSEDWLDYDGFDWQEGLREFTDWELIGKM